MNITKDKVLADYNRLVALAEKLFDKKRYEDCVAVIKTASLLMYNFNIVYTDERLENLLHKIGDFYIRELPAKKNDKIVLFYDWWCWETRGLSTIYINALLKNGYTVIVLTRECNRDGIKWLADLLGVNGSVEFFDTSGSYEIRFENFTQIYKKHLPYAAFFHSMPDDAAGCAFFAKIPCKRYLVNLTDHAYWLGATCVDYSIEFRDYGYSVSKNHRHISEDKLLVLPYYPVHKMVMADSMTDFFAKHKNFVFSGGSLYKIAGSTVFFEIVSYILDSYKNSAFVFIGNGNPENIKNFISQKGYEDRFFYFPERPDFEDFIRHSKFLLSTYPIGGGLMQQLAVVNNKIPLCYNPNMNDDVADDNDNESLFIDTGHNPVISYRTFDELKEEIKRLLTDSDYLTQKEKQLEGMVIAEADFITEIKSILENNNTKYRGKERELNLEEFSQIYIDAENNTNRQYNHIFAQSRNPFVYTHFPIKCFCGAVKIIAMKHCRQKL